MDIRPRRRVGADHGEGRERPGDVPEPALPAGHSGPDEELAARRAEIARMEERALREGESLRVQSGELERRVRALDDRERNLEQQQADLKARKQVLLRELEKISGLSIAQAKQILVAEVEEEARRQAGIVVSEIEAETRQIADQRARSILAATMSRLAGTQASESVTRLVELPTDDMKARIIGSGGRNIRILEHLTGVDFIIDETPKAVTLSSFDGVRREIARNTLERLIADGRIQPASCEEAYEAAKAEVEAQIAEEGEKATLKAGVHGISPELHEVLGSLRFRTSYGQNVLDHLIEAAQLAGMLAHELGASGEIARRATLLHDIGKAVSHEVEGPHAEVGARLARRHGEPDSVVHGIESHHNEVAPRTVEAVIVQIADALSGARPGARGESFEHYVARLRDLEDIAARHPDIDRDKVFAIRAGREVRVMVDPGKVDDDTAALISHQTAKAIGKELDFPGRIKITVIRESRATAFAE